MSPQLPADQELSALRPTEPGTPVGVRFRKWDGSRHWVFDGVYLGSDEHGDWLGYPAGTFFSRPGSQYHADTPGVAVIERHGWVPTLYVGHPHGEAVYIDLATVPEWRNDGISPVWEVTSVDLDLDVIAMEEGYEHPKTGKRYFIDDEDEFAEHTVRYRYPPSVVARVRADADALLAAVRAGEPPYDGATAERWFAVLGAIERT